MALTTRQFAGLVLVASVAVIGAALLSQYWGGLRPCELCLYERWPYDAVIALALVALIVGRPGVSRAALALAALIFVASAVLAFYHIGVEQHWFAGPTACTGGTLDTSSVEALRRQLLATPVVRCDEIQWAVFGINPLTSGNLAASIILAAISGRLMARMGRR